VGKFDDDAVSFSARLIERFMRFAAGGPIHAGRLSAQRVDAARRKSVQPVRRSFRDGSQCHQTASLS